jgi:uncharacterized membrane protein YjjP (DUF1212 family)
MSTMPQSAAPRRSIWKRLFRRGPWETAAIVIIALGVIMLMQPLSLTLYGWSFITTLVGTAMFTFVSKFPE